MQIQRAAEEMKAYVSSDPQERKKAIRWACWARPASCSQRSIALFFYLCKLLLQHSQLICCHFILAYSTKSCQTVITTPSDFKIWWHTTPLFKNWVRWTCEIVMACIWMVFFCFFCREVYMKNISEQELLGKVSRVCQRTDLADTMGQYLDIFLKSVKNTVWGQTG